MFRYLGFITVTLSLSTIVILGFITPNYSHFLDYTSHLGMKDRKYHKFMNTFGFIIPGVFLALFSLYLIKETDLLGKFGALLLGLSGLFWLLIGVFPFDPKDVWSVHEKVVDKANLAGVLSILVFSFYSIINGPVVFGVVSLLVILLLLLRLYTKFETKVVKKGLVQKIVILVFFAWLIGLNFVFM